MPGRLIAVTDWTKYHSWPPLGGLRHLVFNEKTNGFDRVIKRVGRRVLIDEDAFFEWVNEKDAEAEKKNKWRHEAREKRNHEFLDAIK